MKLKLLDIDDATQYYFARKHNAQLASFDRDFDKTDMKRVEPAEVIHHFSS